MSEANEVDVVVKSRIIDRAISFYDNYPTGQYDDEAVLALKHCRSIIDGALNATEVMLRNEELVRVMTKEI